MTETPQFSMTVHEVAAILDVGQGKRLFGLIGTGDSVSRIVGAFSVPILKRRAGPLLAPGMVLAFAGVALAIAGGSGVTWSALAGTLRSNPAPYALALVGAVAPETVVAGHAVDPFPIVVI